MSIGYLRTIIVDISNKLIYGEDCAKVPPKNDWRLKGAWPGGADEAIWIMKQFEVKHDIKF